MDDLKNVDKKFHPGHQWVNHGLTVYNIYIIQSWALAHPSAQLPYFLGAQVGA